MKSILFSISLFLLIYGLPFAAAAQENNRPEKPNGQKAYTIEQACSDRAQLHTIAFDGLAWLTGSFGADCFFPPGKVADYFGFQYMRDNDKNSMGHNTDFLTRIANNVISLLNTDQLNQLVALAKEQENLYTDFAQKRMVLIKAFRQSLEGTMPAGRKTLSRQAVINYCSTLYGIDGELSFNRARVMGVIIRSLTAEQKRAFDKLDFSNSGSWPVLEEKFDKRSLSHRAHVGLMTYASELFSWYKGSLTADTYFCPERHGTYFGGFYLKDYPAMGNHGYSISTALTGDAGHSFLEVLDEGQRKLVEEIPALQKADLNAIVDTRKNIAVLLRKFMEGQSPDKTALLDLTRKYGELDGSLSYLYASRFGQINKTLTNSQKEQLKKLRNLDKWPAGTYLYSDPVSVPGEIDTGFLFE
ncbi:MAG: hypothetical protein U0X40_02790 [Ferruginibacter sp.]